MKISSKSGQMAPWLNFMGAAALAAIFLYLLSLQLPYVLSGEMPATKLLLPLAPLMTALLLLFQAVTVSHDEWTIGDRHILIRSRALPDVLIAPAEIDTIDREQEVRGGDRDDGLPYIRFIVTLKDGRTFESPYLTDDTQINRAWRKLETLLHSGQ